MQLSSRTANKLLKELNDDLKVSEAEEAKLMVTVVSSFEDIEDHRSSYNYEETSNKVNDLKSKIRTLKHAINVHNTTTIIPEINMTIDEALVYLPQLTSLRNKLSNMRQKIDGERNQNYRYGDAVEYTYLNYDRAQINREYHEVLDKINLVQNSLDRVNVSAKFEIDF